MEIKHEILSSKAFAISISYFNSTLFLFCVLTQIRERQIADDQSERIYEPRGVGGGGAMSGFSISPYSSLWFVGTDMGTLFRSVDKLDQVDPSNVYVNGLHTIDDSWGNGGLYYSKSGGSSWSKNTIPAYQSNGRSATIDPNDRSKLFYTFFGSAMLYGPRPQ